MKKNKALITLKITNKEFMNSYTLRGRIGIYIGVLIGLVDIVFLPSDE